MARIDSISLAICRYINYSKKVFVTNFSIRCLLFAGIGANVSRGLAVGIQSGFGEVAGSMASVTAGMVGGVAAGESYAMSNYGNINVIMPQERSSGAQLLRDLSLAMAV